jgi:hypothetical protein
VVAALVEAERVLVGLGATIREVVRRQTVWDSL